MSDQRAQGSIDDAAASYFLPRLVGSSVASEYLLTGRFTSAGKALACGLVSEVVPAEARASFLEKRAPVYRDR